MTASNSYARISVAMATYNGEKYIQEQLDSLARQDLLPMELVVTDDGSTDATLDIIEAFAQGAPFDVRIFRNEARLGYADNFLKAASLCRGTLVAFCDQDDVWLEQKLRVCADFFGDPEVVFVIHSARTITQSGDAIGYFPRFSKTKVLDRCDPFASGPGFATVMRRDLLDLTENHHRPDKLHSKDRWCWFLAASAGKIARIADVLALYRQHETNVFGAPKPRSISSKVRSVCRTLELVYKEDAELELSLSRIMRQAASNHPDRAIRLDRAAEDLGFRSKLHSLRSEIYRNETAFPGRVTAFIRIFFSQGYLPDASRKRLGPRAAIKDLFFGIPRLYQFSGR